MNLCFDESAEIGYHSASQKARVLTEKWVERNMFCPRCGNPRMQHFENNRPVADFYCECCKNEFELKSKSGKLGDKIPDGAYDTMIQRIMSNNNPDFFFMSYSAKELCVTDFIVVPKCFLVPNMIERRRPLAQTARRAGWVGCNILIDQIPEQARISIISAGCVNNPQTVVERLKKINRLAVCDINIRGWIVDVLQCINAIQKREFELGEVYAFERELQIRHPLNNNIRAKIRQQLQLLRDKGFVEFLGNGHYRKIV